MHTTAPPYIEPVSATHEIHDILQGRLASLVDASLTFKHAHWNVRGPGFIAAHELLDRLTADLRAMADETAERIATLGGEADGLAETIASASMHPSYGVGTAVVETHFAALATVLGDLARTHRTSLPMVEGIDPVTTDLLTGQLKRIEFAAWLIRSHLDTGDLGGTA